MKKIFLLLLSAVITASLASSNTSNFGYYKNLGIKAITYPFRQFWNSNRTTKVTIGAVGALLFVAYKLSPYSQKAIENLLSQIDAKLADLQGKPAKRKTLMTHHVSAKSQQDLIQEVTDLINTVDTLGTFSKKQKQRFTQQKLLFNELKKQQNNI